MRVCVKAGLWTLDWTHGLDYGPIFGPSSGPSFGPTELHNDYGRLSFHPIPCGTALFGHVTSGATFTACSQVGSGIRAIESLSLAFFTFVSCLFVSLTVDLG